MSEQLKNQNDPRRGWTSASNAAADAICAGRHQAQIGLPELTSQDAASGTEIHAVLANSGDRVKLQGLTLEQREIFDRCREVEKKISLQMFPDQGGLSPVRAFREIRIWCKIPKVDGDPLSEHFEHSGTPDLVFRSGHQALIIDYKTGNNEAPESPKNLQLRDLAVLVRGNYVVSEVAVVVIQPLVTMEPEVCIYAEADLIRAEKEMFARVRRSNSTDPLKTASDLSCKFCKAKPHCPEYQKFAGAQVPGMLSLLDFPIAAWTPEQRAIFCERRSIAQKWLDETYEAMKAGLEKDPEYVPGWFLKPGAVREAIVNPQEVLNRFTLLGGTVADFMPAVMVAKGKLKVQVNALTGAKGKALEEAMRTLTDGLVETAQNAPSLRKKEEDV